MPETQYIPVAIAVDRQLFEQWKHAYTLDNAIPGEAIADVPIALSISLQTVLHDYIKAIWSSRGPYQCSLVRHKNGTPLYGVFYYEDGKEPRRLDGDTDQLKSNAVRKCRLENYSWNKALYETEMRIEQDGAIIV